MNTSTRALLAVVVIALLGVGVWWAVNSRPSAPSRDNVNTVNAPATTAVGVTSSSNGAKHAVDAVFDYQLSFPESWYFKTFANPVADAGSSDGVLTLGLQNVPFDLQLHPAAGETVIDVRVYTATGNLSTWYDTFAATHTRDIYADVSVDRRTDRIVEAITTGSSPRRPIETEWLDGTLISHFVKVGDYVVHAEAVVPRESQALTPAVNAVLSSVIATNT